MRLTRISRSLLCLPLVFSVACVVHRPIQEDLSLLGGKRVRLRSTYPLAVEPQINGAWASPIGTVTSVEGNLLSVAGDTLVLDNANGTVTGPIVVDKVKGVITGPQSKFRLAPTVRIRMVATRETELTQAKISYFRSAALIVVPPAIVFGILYLQMQPEGYKP